MTEYPLVRAESLIPKGPYCYSLINTPEAEEAWKNEGIIKINLCPFWCRYDAKIYGPLPDDLKEYQQNYYGAYCSYIHSGDWLDDGTMILWDQVKYCCVNDAWDDESGEM